jgi:hypothetical protein
MKKKITAISIVFVAIFFVVLHLIITHGFSDTNVQHFNSTKVERLGNTTFFDYDSSSKISVKNNTIYFQASAIDQGNQTVEIPIQKLLFLHKFFYDIFGNMRQVEILPAPYNTELYEQLGLENSSKKIVFVYPIFTQIAYEKNGFYDYYAGKCDSSCLTLKIEHDIRSQYTSSGRAAAILTILNYSYITDIDIDKNPNILKRYDRVIMLHNEYVTKREFDAVTQHPDVIYLFANALYAQVSTNYDSDTVTLIRGHGYPEASIGNGFDWKFDNSRFEYDNVCNNWKFTKIDNGKMLNCYPSFRLYYDAELLESLKN